ncbi:MAG: hypothetical protein C4B57_11785 [Deltaproteobacteria bacterium]|nr:MAG: hypothetical protein C4B57_11785 [Deltaproteobacteria bacterium]
MYEIGGERARISCCRLLKLLRLNLLYERILPERASHHQRVPERHPGMVAVPREVAGFYSPIAQGIQPELCSSQVCQRCEAEGTQTYFCTSSA